MNVCMRLSGNYIYGIHVTVYVCMYVCMHVRSVNAYLQVLRAALWWTIRTLPRRRSSTCVCPSSARTPYPRPARPCAAVSDRMGATSTRRQEWMWSVAGPQRIMHVCMYVSTCFCVHLSVKRFGSDERATKASKGTSFPYIHSHNYPSPPVPTSSLSLTSGGRPGSRATTGS